MSFRRSLLAAALAAALSLPVAQADPFTFQGFVESAGNPINGSANLRFRVYTAPTFGSQIGDEVVANAYPVADGVFSIDLDFGPSLAFDGSGRFLEVEVNGQVMSPRFAILSAPLASSANALRGRGVSAATPNSGDVLVWNGGQWAPQAGGGGSYFAGVGMNLDGSTFSVAPTYRLPQGCSNGQVAKWNGTAWACAADADTTYAAGGGLSLAGTTFSVSFAGSGVATTAARSDHRHFGQTWSGVDAHGLTLEVNNGGFAALRGFSNAPGTDLAIGVDGAAEDSTNGIGVRGSGNLHGVQGRATTAGGTGVHGLNNSGSGSGIGVHGEAASPDGTGVRGVHMASSGAGFGVSGTTSSANGIGVAGSAASGGGGIGVAGQSSAATGFGVAGFNVATSGDAVGVRGNSAAGSGIGVLGSGGLFGVRGEATEAVGENAGVRGQTSSPSGYGVWGLNLASSGGGSGVFGRTLSSQGSGVQGWASAASGSPTGVFGRSAASAGHGVYGWATDTAGANFGVFGRSDSPAGSGMRAENTATSGSGNALQVVANAPGGDSLVVDANGTGNAWAIVARSAGNPGRAVNAVLTNNASTGVAVYAQVGGAGARAGQFVNLGGGTAASFTGNVDVSGTLSKGGGSFKIDHPLDPENRFLFHSFVESPDMMNIYNGNIVTGKDGFATVELPDWFDTLNRDFRYQLTVIGSFAQAIVAEEVEGNRFVIRTSASGVKVSWQVTGIRQDPWAEANRIQVEVEKNEAERGKYLHPEAWGQPREKAIGFADGADKGED
jgi:hypothetical protein